jgi:hypothetical protein
MILYVGLIAAANVVLGRVSLHYFARRLRQAEWGGCPEVSATIEAARVRPSDQDGEYVGYLIYKYKIEEQAYSGICAKSFSTAQDAWVFVTKWRARNLAVRYKRESPADSMLFPGPAVRR